MNQSLAILLALLLISPMQMFGQEETPAMTLHTAVLQGNMEIVQQFIDNGSSLDEKDAYGSTPLIIATTFGKTETAKTLIEAGADMSISNNQGSTPLHIAALFGRPEIVKILLEKGADRYRRNIDGSTAYDIVAAPFEEDQFLYDQMGAALAPLGLKLDYQAIKNSRPRIARMLRATTKELATVDYRPTQPSDWKISEPKMQELDPLLVAELYYDASQLEKIKSLLVIKKGHLVAEKYYHDGTYDQKTRLQSVTKSFTSALVGMALQQGCLTSPDQKMMAFFPELSNHVGDPRKQQITIRHLLQMRAGYPWEESTDELFDLLYKGFRPSTLADIQLNRDPDTEFQYSNLSSHILGIIVARACDTDLKAFAVKNLFDPLKIEAGEWIQDWEGNYNGHADLHLTARDAAKFGQLYLNKGKYNGTQIVPANWVEQSLQSYSVDVNSGGIINGSVGRYLRHIGYGYQWWSAEVDDYRFNLAWGHGGQFIFLLDEYDMVVVVTSDPFYGQHGDEAWKHERANINLVGKYIQTLIRNDPVHNKSKASN